jgi:hypothetical protein
MERLEKNQFEVESESVAIKEKMLEMERQVSIAEMKIG